MSLPKKIALAAVGNDDERRGGVNGVCAVIAEEIVRNADRQASKSHGVSGRPRAIPSTRAAAKQSPWFAVAVRDMDRIRQKHPKQFAYAFAVWSVLIREAHFKRSNRVTLTADIIADRSGISRRMVFIISEHLAGLGLIKKHTRRDRATGRNTPLVWTIKSAVSFKPSAQDASGQSATDALGSPSAQKIDEPCTHSYNARRAYSKSDAASLRPNTGERAAYAGRAASSVEQADSDDWRSLYQSYRKEDER